MSGILDLASYLRRSGAVIEALLDHASNGTSVSAELRAAAHDAAQDLYALAQDLATSERDGTGSELEH